MFAATAVVVLSLASPAQMPWTITRSMVLKAGEQQITSSGLNSPALIIRGNNLVIDAKNFVLRGSPKTAWPDTRAGLGVQVIGRNITIKNLRVHGYKVALMADGVSNLKLQDCDFSYNWKQRLKSDLEKESLDDWMSFHQNEKGEWLRFGAGIYLKDCKSPEVQGTRITGGQCGLMMTNVTGAKVWNNDFSYLSAIGVGLYRSSDNTIMHNQIDFCVRGYSHGVYNRGQDSAAVLVYEQSHRNTFAYNSATHSGDGFFLWAGQTTMDTGQGGCQDNYVYGNDFSYAPTNGIEATFSRNKFINNRVDECWHGFWLGYSYETIVRGNFARGSEIGIAWEHGQKNVIDANFFSNLTDIHLWQNATQDPNWGYPKHRDTASRGYEIYANHFGGNTGLKLKDTRDVAVSENSFGASQWDISGATDGLLSTRNTFTSSIPSQASGEGNQMVDAPAKSLVPVWTPSRDPKYGRIRSVGADSSQVVDAEPMPLPNAKWPFRSSTEFNNGRRYILVDHWGPYDFRSPIVWPRGPVAESKLGTGAVKFTILGLVGKWKLVGHRGYAKVSSTSGQVPGSIEVIPASSDVLDQRLTLKYIGRETTDVRGIVTPAGKRVRFEYSKYEIPIQWNIEWREWDAKTSDPRTQADAFNQLVSSAPLATAQTSRLSFDWYNSPARGKVGTDYFFTKAEGTMTVPKGGYQLEITTDDGCRVWLDDKLILDKWFYQGPTTYTVPAKLNGKHKLKIMHFEINGFACLKFKVNKA